MAQNDAPELVTFGHNVLVSKIQSRLQVEQANNYKITPYSERKVTIDI